MLKLKLRGNKKAPVRKVIGAHTIVFVGQPPFQCDEIDYPLISDIFEEIPGEPVKQENKNDHKKKIN